MCLWAVCFRLKSPSCWRTSGQLVGRDAMYVDTYSWVSHRPMRPPPCTSGRTSQCDRFSTHHLPIGLDVTTLLYQKKRVVTSGCDHFFFWYEKLLLDRKDPGVSVTLFYLLYAPGIHSVAVCTLPVANRDDDDVFTLILQFSRVPDLPAADRWVQPYRSVGNLFICCGHLQIYWQAMLH